VDDPPPISHYTYTGHLHMNRVVHTAG